MQRDRAKDTQRERQGDSESYRDRERHTEREMERHGENEEVKSSEDTEKLTRKTRIRRERGEPGPETENALGHGGVRVAAACPAHARSRRASGRWAGVGETSLTPWGALSPGFRAWGSRVGERLHLGPHLPCMVAEGVGGSTG